MSRRHKSRYIKFLEEMIHMQEVSKTKISTDLDEQISTRIKFHEQNWRSLKKKYKYHEEKNQHAASFMKKK